MSATRASTVQTLDRGLRLLELLAEADEGLTVAEVASRMGIHRAAAYRLVTTLEGRHYVVRASNGRYRLGTGLLQLSRGVLPGLRWVASPILARLAEDLELTAHLTVIDGEEAVAVAVVEPTGRDIHLSYRPGVRHSLARGASGKAILAGRAPRPAEPAEIATARRLGYASSESELQPGVVGVAAPVVVAGRHAEASVGVIALGELSPRAIARVREAADEMARLLAGS